MTKIIQFITRSFRPVDVWVGSFSLTGTNKLKCTLMNNTFEDPKTLCYVFVLIKYSYFVVLYLSNVLCGK